MKYLIFYLVILVTPTANAQEKSIPWNKKYDWTKKLHVEKWLMTLVDSVKTIHEQKIDFEYPVDPYLIIRYRKIKPKNMLGYYHPKERKIELSKNYFNDSLIKMGKENEISSGWLNFLLSIISHEVGHYITELVAENIANRSLWNYYNDPNDLGSHMIMEGIGEYFQSLVSEYPFALYSGIKLERTWNKGGLTSSNDYERNQLFYMYGYILVKPIIDEFGTKGIEYLLENRLIINPPDLKEAVEYQRKAVERLRNKKKVVLKIKALRPRSEGFFNFLDNKNSNRLLQK